MKQVIDPQDPRVQDIVSDFYQSSISRRQFLERGAVALGSLAAANSLLAACTLPAAPTATPVVAPTATSSATTTPSASEATATAPSASETTAATPSTSAGATAVPSTTASNATGEAVDYPGPGEGYLALPAGSGPFPAVVVIQEWWGLDDHIKSVADRFAHEGFAALAPDLYHGRVATEPDEAQKLALELEQDVALEEIQNAITYLIERPDTTPKKVAIIGFCMGGGLALTAAANGQHIAIVAPFYGRPLSEMAAARLKVPVIGSYGSEDQSIPKASVDRMAEALRKAGQTVDIKWYPAGHAFFNDTRPSYNAAAAADAWTRVLTAFRQQLKS